MDFIEQLRQLLYLIDDDEALRIGQPFAQRLGAASEAGENVGIQEIIDARIRKLLADEISLSCGTRTEKEMVPSLQKRWQMEQSFVFIYHYIEHI